MPTEKEKVSMTQVVLSISDKSILPGLRNILSRVSGVEMVKVVRDSSTKPTKREKFLNDFRKAVSSAKELKEGKTQFKAWEEMIDEL